METGVFPLTFEISGLIQKGDPFPKRLSRGRARDSS